MPLPTTFRDVSPILDILSQKIKFIPMIKSDMVYRKEIAEQLKLLGEIDFESTVIETHSLGEIGRILADNVRNRCAEIVCRIQTFYDTFHDIDKSVRSKRDEFDEYEVNHLFHEFECLQSCAELYRGSLMARGKMPLPDGCTMNDINRELFAYSLDENREKWLLQKRKFLETIRKSIEFAEFLDEPTPPLYHRIRDLCYKLFIITERYFPPCEIRLHTKLSLTFQQKMMQPCGSHLPDIHNSQNTVKSVGSGNRNPQIELFPMILISELYEVCAEVFENPTETQFHCSLNLHGRHEPLKVKPKQKIKVCYLISKLYDIVPEKHKTTWREDILMHFNIDASYYESKYSHPRGSDASRSSLAFADDVDEIIKKHKKRV